MLPLTPAPKEGLISTILAVLAAGAATKVSHNIYLWDRPTGALVKVLEGPKDSLDDCDVSPVGFADGKRYRLSKPQSALIPHTFDTRPEQWHPTKPIIASATSAGTINIWQTAVIDNWSAFAPGFEELEENREYEEKEDEFDIVRLPPRLECRTTIAHEQRLILERHIGGRR